MATWAEQPGNLSPVAASNRLRGGVIMLTLGLVMGIIFAKTEIHLGYRALLFLPFFLAANGFYQGLYRT
jgi:hypothetical protein